MKIIYYFVLVCFITVTCYAADSLRDTIGNAETVEPLVNHEATTSQRSILLHSKPRRAPQRLLNELNLAQDDEILSSREMRKKALAAPLKRIQDQLDKEKQTLEVSRKKVQIASSHRKLKTPVNLENSSRVQTNTQVTGLTQQQFFPTEQAQIAKFCFTNQRYYYPEGYYEKIIFIDFHHQKIPANKNFKSTFIYLYCPETVICQDFTGQTYQGVVPQFLGFACKKWGGDYWLWVDFPQK